MTALVTRTYPATGHALTFRGDGWFNMTTAATHYGKRVDNFMATAETREYIQALAGLVPGNQVTSSVRGNGLRPDVGTWAHPKLAVFFARWLDVKFSVWCDMQIDELLRGHRPDRCFPPSASSSLPISHPMGAILDSQYRSS